MTSRQQREFTRLLLVIYHSYSYYEGEDPITEHNLTDGELSAIEVHLHETEYLSEAHTHTAIVTAHKLLASLDSVSSKYHTTRVAVDSAIVEERERCKTAPMESRRIANLASLIDIKTRLGDTPIVVLTEEERVTLNAQ